MDHTLGGCFVYHAYRFTVHGLQIRIPCGNSSIKFLQRGLQTRFDHAIAAGTSFFNFYALHRRFNVRHIPSPPRGINLTLSIVPWDEPHCK